jgi:RND family efflux transporter MFP subunit
MSKLLGALSLAVLVVFTGTQSYAQAKKGRAAGVHVDAVIAEPLTQTMPVLGRFVARQSGVVAALTRGPVESVSVAVGDRVQKGDVVARLVTARIQAARSLSAAVVKERRARETTAKAQLAQTRKELVRLASLRKSAAFSRARHDDKLLEVAKFKSEVGETDAGVISARAELRLADIDLYNANIRVPYNGVVTKKHTSPGAFLNVGDPVVTLINDELLEVEADVPSDRLSGLSVGRTMPAQLEDGRRIEIEVRAVVPEENTLTRTRPVRFLLKMDGVSDLLVAANQSVTINMPVGRSRDVVSVHKDAIIPRGGESVVFAAIDGKAVRKVLKLGDAVGNRFEVLDGLKLGDLVVVRGNERLRPGQDIAYEGMALPVKENAKKKMKLGREGAQ